MADAYGQEPRVGDMVVFNSPTYGMTIGKVYGFSHGLPKVKYAVKDPNRLLYVWRKSVASYHYVVLNKPTGAWLTGPVNTRLELDYDADEPSFMG